VQTAVLVAAGLTQDDPRAIVLAASAAGTLLRIAHVAWMLRIAAVPAAPVLADLGRSVATAAPLAALVWAADAWGGGAWAFAATAAGGLVTLALAARTRTD